MTKNTLPFFASILLIISCGKNESSSKTSYRTASGTINKTWAPISSTGNTGSWKSIDLSNPNNIIVQGLVKSTYTPAPGNTPSTPNANMPGTTEKMISDCVYASSSQTAVDDLSGYFEVSLVSGNPEVCSYFLPKMFYRHYGVAGSTEEILSIGPNLMK